MRCPSFVSWLVGLCVFLTPSISRGQTDGLPENAVEPESNAQDESESIAGNEQVADIVRSFAPRGAQKDRSLPTPPDQMVARLKGRPDVTVDLVASEPTIAQPLFLSWDSRGRMWVVQYRQYQYPAGLKVVRFDQYLRAVFDKVPPPPPAGPKGADRITVFEDTDGDGLYDRSKDVLSDLNIASSVQVGPQGIWVLNPPYLLRYPDHDQDDIPDGPPEVHLQGFGLQDTHSVANSLLWGPDGWLYGANGSTTAGTVSSSVTKGVSFEGQCIWRYHPTTRVFEIYAEGGGNTFSLDIDSRGRVFSGTNGGSKRGYHYPQGSYSDKNWGKHGPLTNPYAFGYFTGMPMKGDTRRFAQAFAIYEGGLFGQAMQETIVAPNSLHNLVWNSQRVADGSTYRTQDLGNLIETDDRWFRPVYCGVGPDGAIYVADWYDTRLSHVNPVDDWHKDSGRVYRIRPHSTPAAYTEGDLTKKSSAELIELFDHANKWVRRRAMLVLGWRNDSAVVNDLVQRVNQHDCLESLWALGLMQQLDDQNVTAFLESNDADIRRWIVRLLGDEHRSHPQMIQLALTEKHPQVRVQLAATAKRLPAKPALAIIDALTVVTDQNAVDLADPHFPLMLWWALEAKTPSFAEVEAWLSSAEVWQRPLARQVLLSRLMQRYAAEGGKQNLSHCQRLLELAPQTTDRDQLMVGLIAAFTGRSVGQLPDSLQAALREYQKRQGQDGVVIGLRSGDAQAIAQALKWLADRSKPLPLRIEIAEALGQVKAAQAKDLLVRIATGRAGAEAALQRTAIQALGAYDDPRIADQLVGAFYGRISDQDDLRATACRTLSSRPVWAARLLQEVNQWRLKPAQVPQDVVQRLRTYETEPLASQVQQAFGKLIPLSTEQQVAQYQRFESIVAVTKADPKQGRKVFQTKCVQCHQLFGEGKQLGPPLDGYERGNLAFWINNLVAPSAEIREGYQTFRALTDDGRVITGTVAQQDTAKVVLRTDQDQLITLPKDQLEQFGPVSISLMPEGLLKDLTDQQIADLMSYLRL